MITGSKSIAFTNTGVDNLMWIGGGSLFKTETFPGIPFSFILVLIVFGIFTCSSTGPPWAARSTAWAATPRRRASPVSPPRTC